MLTEIFRSLWQCSYFQVQNLIMIIINKFLSCYTVLGSLHTWSHILFLILKKLKLDGASHHQYSRDGIWTLGCLSPGMSVICLSNLLFLYISYSQCFLRWEFIPFLALWLAKQLRKFMTPVSVAGGFRETCGF